MNKYLFVGHNIVLTELPRLSSLDNADIISQIQESVDAALLVELAASQMKDQPLKPIDPVEDVLIQGSQIQIRVCYSNENRGGRVMTFEFDLSTSATASLVNIVPLGQAPEFLSAKMAILNKPFLYVKRIEGRNPVTEISFNGKLISVEGLKEAIKDVPLEQPIYAVTYSGKFQDLQRLKGVLDEPLFIYVADGDVMTASANYDKQTPIQFIDGKLNIEMVIEKENLLSPQKEELFWLKEFPVAKGIIPKTLVEFSSAWETTSPNIVILCESYKLQTAIKNYSDSFGKVLLAGKTLLIPNVTEKVTKMAMALDNGAIGVVSFDRPLSLRQAITLIRELFEYPYKYIGKTLPVAVRKAIEEIGKTNPEVANRLRNSVFNQ